MENVSKNFQKGLSTAFKKELPSFKGGDDIGKLMLSLNQAQKEVTEQDYEEFFEEVEKEESKEATGAGSSGGYSAPLFGEVKKNNLFQPGTESKLTTKPEGGPVKEDKIPGGLADDMTLQDLADHQKTDIETLISQMEKGINVEKEHTSDISIATEIAMDHIYEDLHYYDKLEDMESKPHKEEAKEATTASSSGPYDAPFGGPKKDPLKLSNPDTVYKELRSVKDKNFPKYGGPGGKFVKIKNKCKTFPYCNQGDIKALEFFENNLVNEAIKNISKRYKLNQDYIKGVILENTNIYYKSTEMNKEIENMIDGIVDKVLSEEINKKAKHITESVSEEIDDMTEFYEIAKQRKQERMVTKEDMGKAPEDRDEFDGRPGEVIGVDSNIKKQDEMKEDEKPDFLDLDGDGNKKESMKKAAKDKKKKKKETKEATGASSSGSFNAPLDFHEGKKSLQLSEEEMIDLIEKIIEEQKISGGGKIDGVTSQNKAMKTSEKETNEYHKDLMKKFKEYLKPTKAKGIEVEPKTFPKGNGELEKMEKMAYTPSDSVEEFIDNVSRSGGMENLEYDQIKPDEGWLEKNIMGSSETGNSQEYANAVPTDANEKVNKRRELNILNKLKKQSYEKAPQPVYDLAGEKTHSDIMDLGESKEDKNKTKINEDLERMKKIISHNFKTQ